ncbi:MAG: PEGA domain-containing protein [Bacteroidetes bacterium]|nr:PEGA domain-containing protein [Bacteroidota bacterium]
MLSLVGVLLLISCATITKGSNQLFTVNCNVDGAQVLIDGIEVGVTPFAGEVKKNQKMLTVQKAGYKTYSAALSKNIEGAFWGNIITGGTLGSITDFASGAAYTYAPSSYQVELIEDGMSLNDFEKTFNLKKFAMINMSNIANDLSENDGPYLNSLLQLAGLEVNKNNKDIVLDNLVKSRGDQVVFGKLMVELL